MSQTLNPIVQQQVPHALLDNLLDRHKLKNDAALSRLLEVAPPVISKIRRRTLPVGPALMIRIHKKCGLTIADIEALIELADPAAVPA